MNKLGKREYLKLITDALNHSYGHGGALWEHDTDLKMANAVLKKLTPYLYFHPMDMSPKKFREWKKKRGEQYHYGDFAIET